jgi:hypothetical protein
MPHGDVPAIRSIRYPIPAPDKHAADELGRQPEGVGEIGPATRLAIPFPFAFRRLPGSKRVIQRHATVFEIANSNGFAVFRVAVPVRRVRRLVVCHWPDRV